MGGSIRHSVNFPNANLPYTKDAGVLGQITSFLGARNINIVQQLNTSRGEIAYTVIDMSHTPEDPSKLQADLAAECADVISSRFVSDPFHTELGKPGTYFAVSWDESYN